MNEWLIKDPWIFFGAAGVIVAYVLYMMIRRRKGERTGLAEKETEL